MSDLRYSSRLSPLRAYSVPCPIFVQLRIHSMTHMNSSRYLPTLTLPSNEQEHPASHADKFLLYPSRGHLFHSLWGNWIYVHCPLQRNWTAACEPMAHQIANELITMNATVLCFNSLVCLAATLRFEILLVASSAVYCRRVGAQNVFRSKYLYSCRVSYCIVIFAVTPTLRCK